jgi:hypothetical protein
LFGENLPKNFVRTKYATIRVLASDREELENRPGNSFVDKFHNVLSPRVPGQGSEINPSRAAPITSPVITPEKSEKEPRLESEFSKLEECHVMDQKHNRCLRQSPQRIFALSFESCESCQFRGLHYPTDMGGVTPREQNKIGRSLEVLDRRTDVARMHLEAEKERTDRMPVKIY